LNCSPSTFYPLIETTDPQAYQKLHSLRILFLGGEAISGSRLKPWVESGQCRTEIANVYGAAECTDVSSFYRLKDFERYAKFPVPAGKPIFNSQVYILDKNLNPVPMGITGEICLAGAGVGQGYINDEQLTTEKFVPNPFSSEPGARLYRTGDLGRFLPDENIEFTGRVDHQVKVRGFRIDLGDIETTLRQHDAVREAVVLNREYAGGDQRLVAYLVAKKPAPAEEGPEVRAGHDQLIEGAKLFLKEKLPEYMVPNAFVILKQLPLNPNGKVDRGALPDPETYTPGINARVEAPRTPLEENLVEIFSEFLKLEPLGIDENFFEKGGHSLLATQVISRVNEIFQVKLNQVDFLVDPTVSGLARRIEDNRQASQDEPGENQ
jgi:acyl-coenzyme A synthetase/AMP-(fatty) acid ligase/acyl carrier protein